MAEVSRDHRLDVLHVHYAVPHATAAILARSMLPPEQQPRVVTTLHGTDTTLLGYDPGYAPGHQARADLFRRGHGGVRGTEARDRAGVRLRRTDRRHPQFLRAAPRRADRARTCAEELGLGSEVVVVHSSNLRPGKRIDLLLETAARVRARDGFEAPHPGRGIVCAVRRRCAAARPRRPRHRPREGQRHRGLPSDRRHRALHLRNGELLSEHPRSHVLRLPERLDSCRRDPGGGRGRRERPARARPAMPPRWPDPSRP